MMMMMMMMIIIIIIIIIITELVKLTLPHYKIEYSVIIQAEKSLVARKCS